MSFKFNPVTGKLDLSGGTGVTGNDTEIQFNDSGSLGSSSSLTWDGTDLNASNVVSGGYVRPGASSDTTSGNIRYQSGDLEVYKGSGWVSLTAGAASAAGSKYEIQFNGGAGLTADPGLTYTHDTSNNNRLSIEGETWLTHTEMDHSYIDEVSGNMSNFVLLDKKDLFTFRTVETVEYWDGASWVTWSGPNFQLWVDGRGDTGVDVDSTHKRFRFVIDLGSSFPHASNFVFFQEFSSGTRPFDSVVIEAGSLSGSTFTSAKTLYTSSGTIGNGSDSYYVHIRGSNPDGNRYIRIEIDADITTDNLRLRSCSLISTRASKSPFGNSPYKYDWDKNIYGINSLRVGDKGGNTANSNAILNLRNSQAWSNLLRVYDSGASEVFNISDSRLSRFLDRVNITKNTTNPILTISNGASSGVNENITRLSGYTRDNYESFASIEGYNAGASTASVVAEIEFTRGENNLDNGGFNFRVADKTRTLYDVLTFFGNNDTNGEYDFIINNDAQRVNLFFKKQTSGNIINYEGVTDTLGIGSDTTISSQLYLNEDRGLVTSIDLGLNSNHHLVIEGGADTDDYASIALSHNNTFAGSLIVSRDEGFSSQAGLKIYTNYSAANSDMHERVHFAANGDVLFNAEQLDANFTIEGNGKTVFNIDAGNDEMQFSTNELGFFSATPVTKPTVTGSRGGNVALQNLLTALSNLGLITDSTT